MPPSPLTHIWLEIPLCDEATAMLPPDVTRLMPAATVPIYATAAVGPGDDRRVAAAL